jgi:putative transposase
LPGSINIVKATLRLKLHTDLATDTALHATMRLSTDCFNAVCRYGWNHNERNGILLHRATYADLRKQYDTLPAQLVVSARMKATEALKSVEERRKQDKRVSCPQSELCPIRYDARSYWVRLSEGVASLATVCGRARLTFTLPPCYRQYLTWRMCSADLCYNPYKKRFYLHVVVDTDAPFVTPNGKVVGCDLGVRRVAVTSTPQFFSSAKMHTRVRQHQHLRSALQAKGTKSAKRHLQKASRRWTRFQAHHNHLIANAILAPLQPGDTLALEDLTGIRDRCRHHAAQRGLFHRWSFHQLGTFLHYKAERKGVLIVSVDPRNSSRTCSRCGHCAKSNRKSQSHFVCQSCGYAVNADYNAAHNLCQRGISSLVRLMSASQSQPSAIATPLVSAPGKASDEGDGVEQQRAASPQDLSGGH